MDLAAVMELTNDVRGQSRLDDELPSRRLPRLLQRSLLSRYRCSLLSNPVCSRGTTHISVIDDAGNAAAMTTSNGEGSGLVIPGTGIMMNNMLGEEDINPGGPGHWPCNRRMGSMMAPTLLHTAQGDRIALGSGGSNRIRSAILQTLINVIDLGMDLPQAVSHPRIHYERGRLSVEAGIADEVADALAANFSDIHLWTERNLFFGGVHAVRCSPDAELSASGDPRRGGAALVIG
jgi:gamma-glutamyltranspeptidase/glutathione hydrolase